MKNYTKSEQNHGKYPVFTQNFKFSPIIPASFIMKISQNFITIQRI